MNENYYQVGFYIFSALATVEGVIIYYQHNQIVKLKDYIFLLDEQNDVLTKRIDECVIRIKKLEMKIS